MISGDFMTITDTKVIRFSELQKKIGLSRSTIFRLERDGKFPKHIQLGPKSTGWLMHQVDEWILSRMNSMQGVSHVSEK
jgi:prophage regulatory protein